MRCYALETQKRKMLMENDTKVIIKTFQELTNKEVYELLKLRFKVFVMEQEARYLDPDGIDYSSIH